MPSKKASSAPADTDSADDDDEKPEEVVMVKVPFRGHNFTVPKMMDEWDTEACIAINQGDYLTAAKVLLGPVQWTVLRTLCGTKRKDTNAFLEALGTVTRTEVIN